MKISPRPASGPSFHAGALPLASLTLLAGCGGGGGVGGGTVEKTSLPKGRDEAVRFRVKPGRAAAHGVAVDCAAADGVRP